MEFLSLFASLAVITDWRWVNGIQETRRDARRETRNTRRETQGARHEARDTRREIRDTRHETRDATNNTQHTTHGDTRQNCKIKTHDTGHETKIRTTEISQNVNRHTITTDEKDPEVWPTAIYLDGGGNLGKIKMLSASWFHTTSPKGSTGEGLRRATSAWLVGNLCHMSIRLDIYGYVTLIYMDM